MDSSPSAVTVLHVDDEPAFGDLVSTFLEREGADAGLEVVQVTNGADALDALSEQEVDCIVSDYDMPEMNGLELLNAVRSERPDLPFILFTGKGSEEVARDAFREGVTDYMQKSSGTDHYAVLANRVINAVSQYRAQAASERYGSVFEALENAVYVLDGSGSFTSVNDVFLEVLEVEREAVLGRHVSTLDATDDTLLETFETVVDPEMPNTAGFETRVDAPDTPYVTGRMTHLSPENDATGVVGTLDPSEVGDESSTTSDSEHATLQDVILDTSTSLMSAETDEIGTKIRWTLGSVAEFIGADRCYVFETDAEGWAYKTHEWTAEGVEPQVEQVQEPLESHEWLSERLERFENVNVPCVADLPHQAGVSRTLFDGVRSAVVVPLVAQWQLVGFVGFETTTTERTWSETVVSHVRTVGDMIAHTLDRKRRERELQRQNERLEAFASVISHDLRNPLNVATGFVDIARESGDVEVLDRASVAIDRMESLIEDVLTLAREGRIVGETTSVDLGEAARHAWMAVDTADAELAVTEDLGTITADEGRLSEVFENLFRNAIEHAGDTVNVRVGSCPEGFYVEDDGPGISPEDRQHVIEQGFSTSADGSGLGLAIVSNVVEAHGWNLSVTAGDRGGARFEVTTVSDGTPAVEPVASRCD